MRKKHDEMRCCENRCHAAAAVRFAWPGRDEQAACLMHAAKIAQIAEVMGMHLRMIPIVEGNP